MPLFEGVVRRRRGREDARQLHCALAPAAAAAAARRGSAGQRAAAADAAVAAAAAGGHHVAATHPAARPQDAAGVALQDESGHSTRSVPIPTRNPS